MHTAHAGRNERELRAHNESRSRAIPNFIGMWMMCERATSNTDTAALTGPDRAAKLLLLARRALIHETFTVMIRNRTRRFRSLLVAQAFLPVLAAGQILLAVARITGRNACATGIAVLGFLACPCLAEPPDLSLTDDGSRLALSNLDKSAPAELELTSDDAIPITWQRGEVRQAELPLILMPGVVDPVVMTVLKQPRSIVVAHRGVPQVQVGAAAYAKLSNWRPTSSPAGRRTTLLLAVGMATTLLLASLARRGAALSTGVIAAAWSVGIAVGGSTRPTLIEQTDDDGIQWFLATVPQTVSVPIAADVSLVPVVESEDHLRRVEPRVRLSGKDAALEFQLPANGKVGIRRRPV